MSAEASKKLNQVYSSKEQLGEKGSFLNPAFYYKVKDNNEALMGRYEGDFIFFPERMVDDPDQQDVICSELEVYKGASGMFDRAIAIRQREKKTSMQNTCTVVLGELNISFCSYNYQAKYLHRCIGRVEHQLLQLQISERKARVNAMWEQMNNGHPRFPKVVMTRSVSSEMRPSVTKKQTPGWMAALGFTTNNKPSATRNQEMTQKNSVDIKTGTSEDAKKLAALALSAIKDCSAASSLSKGKIEITEVRDFAGEEVEMKKLVDADSKEAAERAKMSNVPPSALDTVLEQIKKKPKLTVLDKTKKDWGEFKEENRGLEDQLDAYKKSSNQYLDKVSFLQRTDLREFEHERDARLALQAKRRSADFREDGF